jgi:hypothetical protein
MMEQALFQVLVVIMKTELALVLSVATAMTMVNGCCSMFILATVVYAGAAIRASCDLLQYHTLVLSISHLILQQSNGDPGCSGSVFGGGIEADVSLLRSHLRILPSSLLSSLQFNGGDCDYNGNSPDPHCRSSDHPPHVSCVPAPAVLASAAAAAARGSAGGGVCSKRRTADGRGEGTSHGAAAVAGSNSSGRGFWQAQLVRMCSSWWARVMRLLRWLRLLDLWQVLRRGGSALMQLVGSVVVRSVHALQSSSSNSGISGEERVRRQQMVLVAASIVLVAIHLSSHGAQ